MEWLAASNDLEWFPTGLLFDTRESSLEEDQPDRISEVDCVVNQLMQLGIALAIVGSNDDIEGINSEVDVDSHAV